MDGWISDEEEEEGTPKGQQFLMLVSGRESSSSATAQPFRCFHECAASLVQNSGDLKADIIPSPQKLPPRVFGRSFSSPLNELLWVNQSGSGVLAHRLRYIRNYNTKNGILAILTVENLGKRKIIQPGTLDAAILTHVKDPFDFYIVLEKKGSEVYGLNHSLWLEHFPAFKTGTGAHGGIPKLLDMYYRVLLHHMSSDNAKKQLHQNFQPGHLIVLKYVQRVGQKSTGLPFDGKGLININTNTITGIHSKGSPCNSTTTTMSATNFVYEMRRGVVRKVVKPGKEANVPLYLVNLIDYGFDVIVSAEFMFPLPKPFNVIPPLAIHASLFGVSPVGEQWDSVNRFVFTDMIKTHSQSFFSIEVMSKPDPIDSSKPSYPISVNLETHEIKHKEEGDGRYQWLFKSNVAQELIKNGIGIAWNLFPSRPNLMEGSFVTSKEVEQPETAPPRLTFSLREAVLLTPYHTIITDSLSYNSLKNDFKKFVTLRRKHVVDIIGCKNRMVMVINPESEENKKAFVEKIGKPCSVSEALEEMNKKDEGPKTEE